MSIQLTLPHTRQLYPIDSAAWKHASLREEGSYDAMNMHNGLLCNAWSKYLETVDCNCYMHTELWSFAWGKYFSKTEKVKMLQEQFKCTRTERRLFIIYVSV